MEGGNKNNINLESPLDISTSDMLVPVSSPTFQHNWQKFQGKFLPNSLRFEKNGWAAGWNVYNFEYHILRIEVAEGVYVQLLNISRYVKQLTVYDSEDSVKALAAYIVIPETVLVSGDASLAGDTVSGFLNSKPYTLSLSDFSITPGFAVAHNTLSNHTEYIKITDTEESVSADFDLLLSSVLSGDSISDVPFTELNGNTQTWGKYKYNVSANTMVTPENVTVTPTVTDTNLITFDYDAHVTDEVADGLYTFDKYYPKFTDITYKDQSNDDMHIGASPSLSYKFDFHAASSDTTTLLAEDEDGVVIDWKLPLWISAGFTVERENPNAALCNNVDWYEVLLRVGTGLKNKVKWVNAYDESYDGEEELDNFYRKKTAYGSYIKGLKKRFNQILVANTIEPGADYSKTWCKHTVSSSDTWFKSSRQYTNLRTKKTALMTKYLGNLYTWGPFTYKPTDVFALNKPYNWQDPDNCVYTTKNLTPICSIKMKGDADSDDEYDDEQFVEDNNTVNFNIIAMPTSTPTLYVNTQAAQKYEELYTGGQYTGSTYELIGTDDSDEGFWPFMYVPKFNLSLDTGGVDPITGDAIYTTIEGVYWTDGNNYIDDFDEFRTLVIGEYDPDIDPKNSCLVENEQYSRKRIVKIYKPCYDFEYKTAEDFSNQSAYGTYKDNFNATWADYYPDYLSPLDAFDDGNSYDDITYLDYDEEETEFQYDVRPDINYITPGVYVQGSYLAVQFGTSTGLKLYESDNKYTLNPCVYHHTKEVTSEYSNAAMHVTGTLGHAVAMSIDSDGDSFSLTSDALRVPYYFGAAKNEKLVCGGYSPTRFFSGRTTAKLKSAALELGINYTADELFDSDDGWYSEFYPVAAKPKNWLEHLHILYYMGKTYIQDYSVNTGVQAITAPYATGSPVDGVFFAVPVWGHSATRLTYPDMKCQRDINDDDAFYVERVATADLADNTLLYWDRDDTLRCQYLFDVNETAKMPDDNQGGGNYIFQLDKKSDTGSVLWYRKKETDTNNKEIKLSAYIPGVCYDGVTDTTGGLTVTESLPTLELDWVPKIYKIPNSINISYTPVNSLGSSHNFYTSAASVLNISAAIGTFDAANMRMPILFNIGGKTITFYYDVENQKTIYEDGNIDILDDDKNTFTFLDASGKGEKVTITFDLYLYFKNNATRFYVANGATLKSGNDSVVTLDSYGLTITYNVIGRALLMPKADCKVENIMNGVHVHLDGSIDTVLNVAIKNYDGMNFTFEYEGISYDVDLTALLESESYIDVTSTDIKRNKTKKIGQIKSDESYQLVKQQWNTTIEVENFWWVDDKHVLELNQYQLVLKRKTDELDDWAGDRFEKLWSFNRGNILSSNVLRYFVTNCYGSDKSALFITLQLTSNGILVKLYDIREKFETVSEFYISVAQHKIGEILNGTQFIGDVARLNTYNPLTNDFVLTKAEWSNTMIDGLLLLGVHVSNNFDQWTIVYDLENTVITRVIQGYGYVGLKGDLTGGQIPDRWFDVSLGGFSDAVQDVSVLNFIDGRDIDSLDSAYEMGDNWKEKLNYVEERVVGTGEQQWYLGTKVYGIVSHLTYKLGEFTKQLLPITNNYTASFKSPSWSSAVLGDLMIEATPFSKLFTFPSGADVVWNIITTAAGAPQLFALAPRFAQMSYINMTFGQYAYVHYNSSKSPPEAEIGNDNTGSELTPEMRTAGKKPDSNKSADPIMSGAYLFDKQKFSQQLDVDFNVDDSLVFSLIMAFSDSLVDTVNEKLSVNEENAQQAITDFGRKFVDNAMMNAGDMLASNLSTKSRHNTAVTGVVTGVKSLDMFYSTCDQQRVFAGPGFVEHQLVANCVAQSATTIQTEGKSYQLYWALTGLTTLQLEIEIKYTTKAAENLRELSHNWEGATGPCSVNYGAAIAVALTAAATAMELAVVMMEMAGKALTSMLEVLAKRGVTCQQDASVSRHSLSIEGKHKYGEKNETFMWPCWGIEKDKLKYTDEYVESGVRNTMWDLTLHTRKYWLTSALSYITMVPMSYDIPKYSMAQGDKNDLYRVGSPDLVVSDTRNSIDKNSFIYRAGALFGSIPLFQATCYGNSLERSLPDDMAKVEGVSSFLPKDPFRNENIAVSDPAFTPSLFQDYKIDEAWDLGMCCTYGLVQWITVKDTKITNCAPSNMYVNSDFCGIATPYSAIEVKRGLSKAYMRPYAITPSTLAFNCTGYNSILDDKLYHAFDGYSYRIVDLVGSPGMNKNRQSFFYSFQKNDRFKRSNKFPANELQGNFESEPVQSLETIDELFTLLTIAAKEKGLEGGTIGEDKDATRWSIPVFTEPVTTLPAAVKTLTAMPLNVYDGITALTTNLGNNQTAYKAPLSVDFTIGKNVYRQTEEYICSVQTQGAIDIVTELVPSLGLKYIGATPTEAYFYSQATRCYYVFTGSNLMKMDMMERFRDIQRGYWDFVNQEVVMPCLMTFKRLNAEVEDKDTETDNIIVPVLSKGQVSGEVIPPLITIFNDRSWYKAVSLPAGFAYQGPNRVIVNRSIFCEYMIDSLKENFGKWSKMSREKYTTKRIYPENYDTVDKDISEGVDGWTYNPFVLVTSPLGIDEDTDSLFEWTLTFCWPIEMDLIYGTDNYAVVNITAETMTPGGKVRSRPTHVFLTKELFTRNGNYGYYSFRFQSKNGAGNRERLHVWSDQYIAISKIDCDVKAVTSRRHEQLTQQLDVQRLKEL